MMEFSEWITKKYLEWRGDKIGNDGSLAEYGKMFNATHQVISLWMNKEKGIKPRSHKYIHALAAIYGDEVYDVLGLERVESALPIDRIPPDTRERLGRAIKEIADTLASMQIDPSSEQASRLSDEIMARHGWTRTDT